jgi:hypothetical protein
MRLDDSASAESRESLIPANGARHEIALSVTLTAAVLLGGGLLAMRWRLPLLGAHSFRQTQTAITSYWLMRGAPWFAYETPVLGAPWSLPFEFPFYQLLVAGLAKSTGLALDATGRLVSYLFLVLTVIPVGMLARAWKLDSGFIRVFAILLLTSPIYLFWGTAFLIETFVLFFCFWFLAEVELTTRSSSWSAPAFSIFCGAVGALGKVTTFAPFECLAGLILLNDLVKRRDRHEALLRPILSGGAIMAIPPVLFLIWNHFADAEKRKNPLAGYLVSSLPGMRRHYLGTWAQLFSVRMLLTVSRTLTDTLGIVGVPIIIACIALAVVHRIVDDRRKWMIISGALVAFLFPYATFTNLHILHAYYDMENAIFLICALATLIAWLFSTGHRQAGWNLLGITIASQLIWFNMLYVRDIRDPFDRPLMAIAKAISTQTNRDSVVVIYGQTWSSVIPYYAERRALMEPFDPVPHADTLQRARHMLAPQGGHPVEAVVRCKSAMDQFPEFNQIFANLDTHFSKQRIAGCDVYFVNRASTHLPTIILGGRGGMK